MASESKTPVGRTVQFQITTLCNMSEPCIFTFPADATFLSLERLDVKTYPLVEGRLLLNGKYIGWDIPLTDLISTWKDHKCYYLNFLSVQKPWTRLKHAFWARHHKIQWPAWKEGDTCFFNGEPLGQWEGYGQGPITVTPEKNNTMEYLAFLICGQANKQTVVNHACLLSWLRINSHCPLCRQPLKITEKRFKSRVYRHGLLTISIHTL